MQNVLIKNPRIKEVYFAENGDYYFMKHKVSIHKTNDLNQTVSVEEVECLPGAKLGIVMIKSMVNGSPVWKGARRNIECEKVAASFTREEVLKAIPVLEAKTESEKIAILLQAQEIMKSKEGEELLAKLKK